MLFQQSAPHEALEHMGAHAWEHVQPKLSRALCLLPTHLLELELHGWPSVQQPGNFVQIQSIVQGSLARRAT